MQQQRLSATKNKNINNDDDNFFNLIFFICCLPEFNRLSVFSWSSLSFLHVCLISSYIIYFITSQVNSHVSCPGRSPGHLPIPKHSLELWRVQAWVEGGALETTQSHQPRNWVGPAQNQASTLRFYISSAASPHVHNGTGGRRVLWNVTLTWPLLHDISLYPEESQQDHLYFFSSDQIKAILKQCVFREAH